MPTPAASTRQASTTCNKTIALISLARPQFDVQYASGMLQASQNALAQEGFTIQAYDRLIMTAQDAHAACAWLQEVAPAALIVQQGTFADATLVMTITSEATCPALLWAVREPSAGAASRLRLNSFCGMNLAAYALAHSGRPFASVFGDPSEPAALKKVCDFIRGCCVSESLQRDKILVVGGAPAGYYPSNYNALDLKSQWGVDAVRVSLQSIFEAANQIDASAVDALRQELQASLKGLNEIKASAVDKSIRGYLALQQVLQKHAASACAVECWPDFTDTFGGAACFALGRLNNEGIPSACEAEVHGALIMLAMQRLTGTATYFGDMVHINEKNQSIIFWHCGAGAACLAEDPCAICAGIQPNRKAGLAFAFALKSGPVTVAQLGVAPEGGYRMLILQGDAIEAPLWFQGTGVEIKFSTPPGKIFDAIAQSGFGHHYVAAYGNIAEELKTICRLKNINVVTV